MSYKILGDYIQQVNFRNKDLEVETLLGVSNTKKMIPSIANTIGTDMSTYKIIEKRQFAYGTITSRNGDRLSVAISDKHEKALVSQIYIVFEVIDDTKLLPEYLMMWFSRPEFDRYARFHSHGSTREAFDWADMCEVELPVPFIEEQQQIVAQYQSITKKIKVNEQICEKLEATAQALYKHWFVDFEFPAVTSSGVEMPYKSSGGKMVWNEELGKEIPEGWEVKNLGEICEKIASGSTPSGGKENYKREGISLVRSMNVYDLDFIYDDLAFIDETQAKKLANVIIKENDVLINITGVSVARCTIVPSDILPARVNQHVMIIRSKENFRLNYYMLFNLVSHESKNQLLGVSQSGSTREAITKSDIEGFLILLPDLKLIDLFNSTVKITIEFINKIRNQNQKLTQLQSLLLARLAVGEEVSA
ncbi:restriction endonuclease subunit S [Sphingobacterium sp. ML3W]|uniref:restriction endonuclease subunit S n=1 Tax=Sphingobacterium sp. ML3W TaxID=1538644 RepID=UPI000AB201B4|nr:restriction endonuclease subunit S [Sphingobacterium sp. ML3W]